AQHRDDLADRRAPGVRRLHHLAHHQLAFARVGGGVGRDMQVALQAPVIGYHEADAGLGAEAADQALDPTLEHPGDAAFATATAVDAGDVGQGAVTMHDLAHLVRGQEQVVAATGIRAQEAEPFRIGDHRALDQVGVLHRGETATPVLHQLAVAHHRTQALAQGIEPVRLHQAELLRELRRGLRTVGLLQRRQDGLAAGDGVLVAFGLAGRMRVLDAGPGTGAASAAAAPRLAWRRRRRLRHPRRTPAALARTT